MSAFQHSEWDEHLRHVLPKDHPLRGRVLPMLYSPDNSIVTSQLAGKLTKAQSVAVKRVDYVLRRLRDTKPVRVFGRNWAIVATADAGPDVVTALIYNLTGGRPIKKKMRRWTPAPAGEFLTNGVELWLGQWQVIAVYYNDWGDFISQIDLDVGDHF